MRTNKNRGSSQLQSSHITMEYKPLPASASVGCCGISFPEDMTNFESIKPLEKVPAITNNWVQESVFDESFIIKVLIASASNFNPSE
ncbi:hypothetical protein QQP08_007953, partial [Theobroma cacao]